MECIECMVVAGMGGGGREQEGGEGEGRRPNQRQTAKAREEVKGGQ